MFCFVIVCFSLIRSRELFATTDATVDTSFTHRNFSRAKNGFANHWKAVQYQTKKREEMCNPFIYFYLLYEWVSEWWVWLNRAPAFICSIQLPLTKSMCARVCVCVAVWVLYINHYYCTPISERLNDMCIHRCGPMPLCALAVHSPFWLEIIIDNRKYCRCRCFF